MLTSKEKSLQNLELWTEDEVSPSNPSLAFVKLQC